MTAEHLTAVKEVSRGGRPTSLVSARSRGGWRRAWVAMTACGAVVRYLTALAGAEEKAVEAAKEIDHGGMVAMGKKAIDDDAESWGGLAKGKNKKKKKKGGKATPKVMQHPVAKIGAFHEIGLEPPSSADQIPGLLDTLNAKIAEYVEKAKTYKPKTKVASKPRKVALRIQPRGESDLKVIIDVIPGN